MNPRVTCTLIGGALGVGFRVLKTAHEYGGLQRAWKFARKDLFVKSSRDGAIGGAAGFLVGKGIQTVQKANVQRFERLWSTLTEGIPENGLVDYGTFHAMPDHKLYFNPMSPETGAVSTGEFSIKPMSRAKTPETKRRFKFEFLRTPQNPSDQPPIWIPRIFRTFKISWRSVPTVVKEQLKKHSLTAIPSRQAEF